MSTLVVAIGAGVLYVLAYHTYGRFLARKIFNLDPNRLTPAYEYRDDVDYVPSAKAVVFGHHFVSIAGTGPIVGPAVAIIWGWVPALLWILLGSIFMGAVHDLGALVVSLRNRGATIGEISRDIINPRVRVLFLTIVLFSLLLVIAVFGLVIASVFQTFPESVFAVWIQIPIAVGLGMWMRRRGGSYLVPSIVALGVMYMTVYLGGKYSFLQFTWPAELTQYLSPAAIWTIILIAYCFFASTLPVQTLLQPRDYINSNQLTVAMALILLGALFARPEFVAPAMNLGASKPMALGGAGAPAFFPFLFTTVACGAISGFHALVSSGVSSKQLSRETDAVAVGYGAMLLEGFLGVLVILAVGAGIGMNYQAKLQVPSFPSGTFVESEARLQTQYASDLEMLKNSAQNVVFLDKDRNEVDENSPLAARVEGTLVGDKAWGFHYRSWNTADGLGDKIGAFVRGAANMLQTGIGLPKWFALALMGVLVASFAGTTMDTATRLQRYVITELASEVNLPSLTNRYVATSVATVSALGLALCDALWDGLANSGKGALTLWPLFASVNQLLAALTLLVLSFWLYRNGKPFLLTAIPMVLMFVVTGWAMADEIGTYWSKVIKEDFKNLQLLVIGVLVLVLEAWMILEALGVVKTLRAGRTAEIADQAEAE